MKKRYIIGIIVLVIIGFLGLFAALGTAALIALNPAKNFAEARNSVRITDIDTLVAGIEAYSYDIYTNQEEYPDEFLTITDCTVGADPILLGGFLDNALVDGYLVGLPIDPSIETGGEDTGYAMCMNGENIYFFAPLFEDV